jgi:hypothetical protein
MTKNKELIERYPYLLPRNVWTDKVDDDYDYSWTLADQAPDGWRELFLQMCEEIREPLIAANYLNEFRFSQIKEKFGTLRAYSFGAPREVHNIISKYERMSARMCIKCGATATKISRGWISPWCDKHAFLIDDDMIDIDEWFKEEEET